MTDHPILPGRLGNLTEEQQQALDGIKKHLNETGLFNASRHDDHYLLRFLRARKFDLPKTIEMVDKCENWRKEKQVDQLVETFKFEESDKVQEIYPRFYHKTDVQGRPVYVEVLGKLDLDKLFKITTKERMESFFICEYERLMRVRLPACSKAAGHHIETSLTILDLKNCGVMQAYKIKDLLKMIVDIGQNYYPESMGMTFIVNAPWLFDTIWSFLKHWLDEVTVAKIRIYKSGKDFSKELFSLVEPQNLPFILGGACQCEGGCENSDQGPWSEK